MKFVGYIAGNTLEALQKQWVELLDADADLILFDRTFLKSVTSDGHATPPPPEQHKMWRYAETMLAGQDISGNSDNYQTLGDLASGDHVVITDLDILQSSRSGLWDDLLQLHRNGIGLIVLRSRFNSSGPYGDEVMEMMSKLYKLGKSR